MNYTTPGVWKDAWDSYKNGNRDESNLVVRALSFINKCQNAHVVPY